VQGLQEQGHVVAFVGDGLNDTLAMAAADVGVAVGQSYRYFPSPLSVPASCWHLILTVCVTFSVFLDAADVVLAKRRIGDVATMLHLRYAILCEEHLYSCVCMCALPKIFPSPPFSSHVTFRRILMNIAWATLYNLFMIPLAAGALYPR